MIEEPEDGGACNKDDQLSKGAAQKFAWLLLVENYKPYMIAISRLKEFVLKCFMAKRCRAIARSTGDQCKKTVRFGPYCWSHTPKIDHFVFLVIGAVLSLLLQEVYRHFVPSVEFQMTRFTAALDNPIRTVQLRIDFDAPHRFADICPFWIGVEFTTLGSRREEPQLRFDVRDEHLRRTGPQPNPRLEAYTARRFVKPTEILAKITRSTTRTEVADLQFELPAVMNEEGPYYLLRSLDGARFALYVPEHLHDVARSVSLRVNGWDVLSCKAARANWDRVKPDWIPQTEVFELLAFRCRIDLGAVPRAYKTSGEPLPSDIIFFHESTPGNEPLKGMYSPDVEALVNEAHSLYQAGNLKEASIRLREALVLAERRGDPLGAAIARVNLGRVFLDQNDVVEAIGFFELAIPVFRDLKHFCSQAKTLVSLGVAYRKLGRHGESDDAFDRAMSICRLHRCPDAETGVLIGKGINAALAGRCATAREYFKSALDVATEARFQHGIQIANESLQKVLSCDESSASRKEPAEPPKDPTVN